MSMITLFQSNGSKEPSITEKIEAQQLELQQVSAQLQAQRQRASEETELLKIYEQSLENCQQVMNDLRKEEARQIAEVQLIGDVQELRSVAEKINNLSEQLSAALTEFEQMTTSRVSLNQLRAKGHIGTDNLRQMSRPESIGAMWQVLPMISHRKGTDRFIARWRFSSTEGDRLKLQRESEK